MPLGFSLEEMGRGSLLQKFSVFNMFIGIMDTQEKGYSVQYFCYLLDYDFNFFMDRGIFCGLSYSKENRQRPGN